MQNVKKVLYWSHMEVDLSYMFLMAGKTRATRGRPCEQRGEHTNSIQKSPTPAMNQSENLLAMRQQQNALQWPLIDPFTHTFHRRAAMLGLLEEQ